MATYATTRNIDQWLSCSLLARCSVHNRATTHTEFQSSCELAYGLASGVPEQAVIYFFINTAGVLFMMAYLTLIVDSNCPLFYAPPPR